MLIVIELVEFVLGVVAVVVAIGPGSRDAVQNGSESLVYPRSGYDFYNYTLMGR